MIKHDISRFSIFSIAILVFILLSNSAFAKKNEPTILVVSGWQDVNIGDIAHTPGLLYLLEKNQPKANIILWKKSKSEKVEQLLAKEFPKIRIIHGNPETNPEVMQAIKKADLFIHGSGPYLVAPDYTTKWMELTNKPFGFFGVTFENPKKEDIDILKKAAFIFPRDTESIQHLEKEGVKGKQVIFGPDATFALNVRNESKAQEFMKQHDLKEKDFLCVVTRLRKSPYWWDNPQYYSKEVIAEYSALNDKWKYDDNDKLCLAIVEWVRKTKKKVVLCPEMSYQTKVMDDLIIDRLPEDVKPFVIKHDYWLPDEAISFYAHAHSIISMECHTVIMAVAVGTPVFYLRQPQDTIKGQMFYDLGLDKWVFEIEQSTGKQIADRLMEVFQDYNRAQKYLKTAQKKVDNQYKQTFRLIERVLTAN
jgi:polysaccharide pyruvyl transferase WcaK-like protein